MRILHVTQYFMPWLGYQEFYLAREQIRNGHEIQVISSNLRWPLGNYAALRSRGEPRDMPVGDRLEHGIPTVRLKPQATVRGRLVLGGLTRAVAAFSPDVVHAHGYLMPATVALAALRRRQGSRFCLVVDEHQLPSQANNDRIHVLERRIAAFLARRYILPSVDLLVAVAPGAMDWLSREYGCAGRRVALAPLGADTDVFKPDALSGTRARSALNVPAGRHVILYSGKIAEHKRVDLLIQAVAALPHPLDPVLIAVGDADAETQRRLVRLAADLRVEFHQLPAVSPDALAAYFNAADLCVWPADCSVSHLEAAACAKPIIIPDDPGIRDRLSAGNGLGVSVGDVPGLTAAIARLLHDDVLRIRMGRSGRALIESEYSWRSIARRFEELYDDAWAVRHSQ